MILRQTTILLSVILLLALNCAGQASVLTNRNDNARSALNPNETILATSNVNVNQFGKLFSLPTDGQVYAQPLYVPAVTFPGNVTHNVLIVATQNDSVYAFDADSNTGANATPLWVASLVDAGHGGAPGETPFFNPQSMLGCSAITPEIGIISTPVIDMNTAPTPTIFVTAKSVIGSNYINRLHALDITTGSERPQGPVIITAAQGGTGFASQNGVIAFDPLHDFNRPGLLLLNGNIYIAFASICSPTSWHGWIIAYDESSFTEKSSFLTTPNGYYGGIWMSGTGLSADSAGAIFVVTGDGTFDTDVPITDLGDSIVKLSTGNGFQGEGYLSVEDYFTPFEEESLLLNDKDLGSGGVLLLPDQPGNHPHLLVEVGKEGKIYLVDRDQMTSNPSVPSQAEHYCTGCPSDPQILQESPFNIGGIFGSPAYWNKNLYFWGANDVLRSIPMVNGVLNYAAMTSNSISLGFPGAVPAVSSNGTAAGTAILWAIDASAAANGGPAGPAVLYAYDASNLSNLLWTSNQAESGRDQAGIAVKFTIPTIINGKVYVGASGEVDVYGLLPTVRLPSSVLSIFKTHTGAVVQGQQGPSYTVTVSNAANAAQTNGQVTVTDTLPSGLALASMGGAGWTCLANACTRNDLLNGGESYPAIIVTVNVAINAISPQVNQVSVSGGNSASASASDATVIIAPAGSAASIATVSGTPQSAPVNTAFSFPLQAIVMDAQGNPVSGVVVTFTSSANGAGGTFANGAATAATTNAQGIATASVLTANSTPGFYTVTAAVSGLSVPASFSLTNITSSASFVGFDWTTRGSWIGAYGQDGYSLAGNPIPQKLPSYVQAFTPENSLGYIWAWPASSLDLTALQTDVYGGRAALTWYNVPTFSFDLNITGGTPQRVAFYATDYSMKSRIQTIQIVDANTNAVIDQESVSNFNPGVYFVWMISGHVTVNVICDGGENAVVSAVFFGGSSGASNPINVRISPQSVNLTVDQSQQFTALVAGTANQSVTWTYAPAIGTLSTGGNYTAPEAISPQTVFLTATSVADPTMSATAIVNLTGGATANFAGTDTGTQGNWRGAYGADGYFIAGDSQVAPPYAFFNAENVDNYTWNANTSDVRALILGDGSGRIAASWVNFVQFSFQVNITDGRSHRVALYALDWDMQGRTETIQIVDAVTNIQLDTRTISNFGNGTYLIWNISGNVNVNVTYTGGPNGVVSGVFFGGNGSSGGTETVTVSPTSTTLSANGSAQFGATVANATSQAVTWSISAVNPSGAATGSFSTTTPGLYLAPSTVSVATTVTVKATSADGTASGTATVNLSPSSGTAGATAIFLPPQDASTGGSWQGKYGSDGYDLVNVPSSVPSSYATFAVQNATTYTWASPTSDARALQNPGGTGGIAAAWYSPSTFSFAVNFTDGATHQFALYAVDWDGKGRSEEIQIVDASRGTQLDSETITSFGNGTYLAWNISGSVKINVTTVSGPNAVVSGVFFGGSTGSGGSGTETVTVSPTGANLAAGAMNQFGATVTNATSQAVTWSISAVNPSGAATGSFSTTTPGLYLAPSTVSVATTVTVKATSADGTASGTATVNLSPSSGTAGATAIFLPPQDASTGGSWQGKYGSDGYDLVNVPSSVPSSYATFAVQNATTYTWASPTSDARALQNPGGTGGIAAAWYSPSTFSFAVNFTDGATHQFALYAVDWDGKGRSEEIQIVDASRGTQLDSETITSFGNGTYLAWNISGSVKINVTTVSGPNAVVSGVFFGSSVPASPLITSASVATFTAGTNGTFTVAATGVPTPALSATQPLPSGVSFVDNGNGTGTLSGTGNQLTATGSPFSLTLTASNGVSPAATQSFLLTVNRPVVNVGPTATFVKADTSTQGNWIGMYGADGYDLALGPQSPANGQLTYGTYAVQNQDNWTWAASTSDPRALETDSKGDRLAATWYSPANFSFDVNFTDGNTHQVALYVVNWDDQGRAETVQVLNASNPGAPALDSQSIPNTNSSSPSYTNTTGGNFENGTYLIWEISGHVTIQVSNTSSPNAVVSGVFFGGSSVSTILISPKTPVLSAMKKRRLIPANHASSHSGFEQIQGEIQYAFGRATATSQPPKASLIATAFWDTRRKRARAVLSSSHRGWTRAGVSIIWTALALLLLSLPYYGARFRQRLDQ